MPHVARSGEIGRLLQTVLDQKGLSKAGFADLLTARFGGQKHSWRSQIQRVTRTKKPQIPGRLTLIQFAEALELEREFFFPEPDQEVVDLAMLNQFVGRLEALTPSELEATLEESRPYLQELADQFGELAFRFRQAIERLDER